MQSQVQTLPLPQSKPVTELLTDDELSAYDNAGKSTEQTIPVLNDFLQKLATLDSAMIGGGLLIAKGDILPIQFGIFALLILTASLLCAIIGWKPLIFSNAKLGQYPKSDPVQMYYDDGFAFIVQGKSVQSLNFYEGWKGTVKGIKIGDTKEQVEKVFVGKFRPDPDIDNDYIVQLKDSDAEMIVVFDKKSKITKLIVYLK